MTTGLEQACRKFGIKLLDHLIMGHGTYVSLASLRKAHRDDVTMQMRDIVCHQTRIVDNPVAGEGVEQQIPVVSVHLVRTKTTTKAPAFLRSHRAAADAFANVFHLGAAESEDDRLCLFFLDPEDAVIGCGEIKKCSRFCGVDLARIVYGAAILHNADAVAVAWHSDPHLSFASDEKEPCFLHIVNMGLALGIRPHDYFLFGNGEYASLECWIHVSKKKGKRKHFVAKEIFKTLCRPEEEQKSKCRRKLP